MPQPAACTLTPRQNDVVLCKSLRSTADATRWEGLNFSHDLYHGLGFEETVSASHPPSLCRKPLFIFVVFYGSERLSRDQITWLTGSCHGQEVKMDDGLPIRGASHAHPTSFGKFLLQC